MLGRAAVADHKAGQDLVTVVVRAGSPRRPKSATSRRRRGCSVTPSGNWCAGVNGCAYCIDMHTRDARAIGETEQRIYGLAAWRETPYFTPRERAALAFTETVTRLSETHVPEQAYQDVAAEFSPQQVAALVSLIVTINAWNAIGVSTRAWAPGSYNP